MTIWDEETVALAVSVAKAYGETKVQRAYARALRLTPMTEFNAEGREAGLTVIDTQTSPTRVVDRAAVLVMFKAELRRLLTRTNNGVGANRGGVTCLPSSNQ